MAYSTIPKGSLYMNTKLYAGNGNARSITGVGFQPDWVWIKNRTIGANHALFDVIRGATKVLNSNATTAEATEAQMLTAFGSDGFSVGTDSTVNDNGSNIVSWNWKANGAGSANTDGSINSTVSANTTSGFSIVSYTGTGSNATVGHGLGAVPKIIFVKTRSTSNIWAVYHVGIGNTKYMQLNEPDTPTTNNTYWNNTTPTSSVFSVGTASGVNGSGVTNIAYCFADVKGFSKISSYTGNASTDGTFVYCGFKPSFIFTKATATGEGWQIYDNKRLGVNATEKVLYPNTSSSESTLAGGVDFLSNGFKWRTADGGVNSSQLYIYMAFAENPFVATSGTNAVPVTAR